MHFSPFWFIWTLFLLSYGSESLKSWNEVPAGLKVIPPWAEGKLRIFPPCRALKSTAKALSILLNK